MTERLATYRLQFRDGMDFDRAAALVPYLADLGISHLYASPVFKARSGSTHGYDVTDHGMMDPVLGGEDGWDRLTAALRRHGLGLLLDIVPNHMAVSTENPWWDDVLTWGRDSRWAAHFDIDWSAGPLLLPVLGEPYGEALAAGAFELRVVRQRGSLEYGYHDHALPLTPPSYAAVLGAAAPELARLFATAGPDAGAATAMAALRAALADVATRGPIEDTVAAVNADAERLHALHEAQPWRLGHWRLAREMLPYRRFFEISDLVGVRVEDPAVFKDVHARALAMLADGTVDGLRIDHIDGLADPKGYLEALRDAAGAPYVVVEKILMPGETLPAEWPTAGTTGYELGRLLCAVQIDPASRQAMTEAWTGFTGESPDFTAAVAGAKRRILVVNLAGELEGLVGLAHRIAAAHRATRDLGRDSLRTALVELLVELPVYRSYADAAGCSADDAGMLAAAAERAGNHPFIEDRRPLDFLIGLVAGTVETAADAPRAEFVRRFQQASGPAMAKAVEDTTFYRFNRLIALNEVGSEPEPFGMSVADFHAEVAERLRTQQHALSATATHDTKRGEDARLRIAMIAQQPERWRDDVGRWHAATADLRTTGPGGAPMPDPNDEWLFYQSLLGAWPEDFEPGDQAARDALSRRLEAFMVKALREAKRHTTWTAPDAGYEEATSRFVRGVLGRRDLLADMGAAFAPLIAAGAVASLAQLALKLTLPGIPDIYQGTELWDLSLVDPDNRRPVDFESRSRILAELPSMTPARPVDRWRDGAPKLWLLHRLLALRRAAPALFRDGGYQPVEVSGPAAGHLLAFARHSAAAAVIVVVPRLPLRILREPSGPALSPAAIAGTRLGLPDGLPRAALRDWLGETSVVAVDGQLDPSESLHAFPVAVYVAGDGVETLLRAATGPLPPAFAEATSS